MLLSTVLTSFGGNTTFVMTRTFIGGFLDTLVSELGGKMRNWNQMFSKVSRKSTTLIKKTTLSHEINPYAQ